MPLNDVTRIGFVLYKCLQWPLLNVVYKEIKTVHFITLQTR